jgi:hypothetical protein
MPALLPRITQLDKVATRDSARMLAFILLVAAACSTLQALSRPLWNDEIITVIMSGLPGLRDIWNALDDAADTNPPGFYVAARFARWFVTDDHLAHRLPSIAGCLIAIVCVFLFLSRRASNLSAVVGATFLLTTPLGEYAYEARPYALMIGCISAALLFWQRADSKWNALPLALALAASVSLHYYAVFVWPVFIVAEGMVSIRRRFRLHVWLAIVAALTPLFFFSPLLMKLREYYGGDFWARTYLAQSVMAHDWLFLGKGHWGVTLAAGLSLALVYWVGSGQRQFQEAPTSTPNAPVVPDEEYVLVFMMLWLPAIAVAIALVGGAGLTERHFLPATVGGGLALGLLVERLRRGVRAVVLALMVSSYLYSSHHEIGMAWQRTLLDQRRGKTAEVEDIVKAGAADAPLVFASALEYLETAYFAPPPSRGRLHFIGDPAGAVRFTGSGSRDLALLRLQHWFPLQVEAYPEFTAKHRDFVLVVGKDPYSQWWPRRLLHDGHRLRLLSMTAGRPIYEVALQP